MNTHLIPLPLKKLSFFLMTFFALGNLSAQEEQPKDSIQTKHEVRLDIFQLIVLPGIELSYEHYIDDVSSWGVSTFFNFDRSYSEGYRFESFEVSPYYRLYFRAKKDHNSGFFVQPFVSLTQGVYDNYDGSNGYYSESDYFGFAAGALIGRKWVNKLKYTFEIHVGVGRFLNFEEGSAYPRINFAIGKRF